MQRNIFTSLASRLDDNTDTRLNLNFSTVILCGITGNGFRAMEDILYSKFSFHIVGIRVGSQILPISLTEKLIGLISGKQFIEADKLILASLRNVFEDCLNSWSSGSCSFWLSSLMNSEGFKDRQQSTGNSDSHHPAGADIIFTQVYCVPFSCYFCNYHVGVYHRSCKA